MHGANHILHPRERLGRLVHDEIGTFGHYREIVIGHECGDLDDDVTVGIEARHLEVHPHEHVADRRVRLVRASERSGEPQHTSWS